MRLILWQAAKGYEAILGPAVVRGAALNGITVETRSLDDYRGPEADGGIIFGVVKREVLWDHQRAGHPIIYIDKGFSRSRTIWQGNNVPGWWRVCINASHPTAYMMDHPYPIDRMKRAGMKLQRRRKGGETIVIAGSSEKFHLAHGLPHPTEWAKGVLAEIRRHTDAPVIYRPKQSWRGAEAIEGAIFDHGAKTPFGSVLEQARCVITHGSGAGVDAIMAGVPCITLGDGPARPVSGHQIETINDPWWPDIAIRRQWAANLAYFNWRPDELENGVACQALTEQMGRLFDREQAHARRAPEAV